MLYEKFSFILSKYGPNQFVFKFFGGFGMSAAEPAQVFHPPDPNPPQMSEDRIPFELFLIYTASWNFANQRKLPSEAKKTISSFSLAANSF